MDTTPVQEEALQNPGNYRLYFFVTMDWLQATAALDALYAIRKPVQYGMNIYTWLKWEPDYVNNAVWVYIHVESTVGVQFLNTQLILNNSQIRTSSGTFIQPVNQPAPTIAPVVIIAATVGVLLAGVFIFLSLSKIEQITSDVASSPALSLSVVAVVIIAGVIVWKTVLKK